MSQTDVVTLSKIWELEASMLPHMLLPCIRRRPAEVKQQHDDAPQMPGENCDANSLEDEWPPAALGAAASGIGKELRHAIFRPNGSNSASAIPAESTQDMKCIAIPEELYTADDQHPYRGIWIG